MRNFKQALPFVLMGGAMLYAAINRDDDGNIPEKVGRNATVAMAMGAGMVADRIIRTL